MQYYISTLYHYFSDFQLLIKPPWYLLDILMAIFLKKENHLQELF